MQRQGSLTGLAPALSAPLAAVCVEPSAQEDQAAARATARRTAKRRALAPTRDTSVATLWGCVLHSDLNARTSWSRSLFATSSSRHQPVLKTCMMSAPDFRDIRYSEICTCSCSGLVRQGFDHFDCAPFEAGRARAPGGAYSLFTHKEKQTRTPERVRNDPSIFFCIPRYLHR